MTQNAADCWVNVLNYFTKFSLESYKAILEPCLALYPRIDFAQIKNLTQTSILLLMESKSESKSGAVDCRDRLFQAALEWITKSPFRSKRDITQDLVLFARVSFNDLSLASLQLASAVPQVSMSPALLGGYTKALEKRLFSQRPIWKYDSQIKGSETSDGDLDLDLVIPHKRKSRIAFDGMVGSWIQFDALEEVVFNQLEVISEGGTVWDVEASHTAEKGEWLVLASIRLSKGSTWVKFPHSGESFRYWRVVCTENSAEPWYHKFFWGFIDD